MAVQSEMEVVVQTAAGVRRDLRALAFWLGSITTGADGRATTSVTLPDSLTTYRIMAVAGNEASQFGFGEHEIRVNKPLTLLTAFPRFLNKGFDPASFGAVVTNAGKTSGPSSSRFKVWIHRRCSSAQQVRLSSAGRVAVREVRRRRGCQRRGRVRMTATLAPRQTPWKCP
jgi:uncharacterized protein YfaS (alpha-2-macroglobulin family)